VRDRFLITQVSANMQSATGDYVYRIMQPAEAMGRVSDTMVVNMAVISPHLKELCLCADILVLHLTWEPDLLPIVAERKRRGLATVFEISDNFIALPPAVTHELSFNNPISLATTFQLISLSDAIQGVSDILLDRFSFLHDRRMVFENHIMETGLMPMARGDEVVIGWGGSVGHTEDLKWIAPIVGELCKANPRVRFAFMGNRKQYDQVFGPVANHQFSYRAGSSLSEYLDFLASLDIGLAPLMDTPFNICRSDVKFIEYASRGVVPVLSDVGPYRKHARHGINSFFFQGPESLRIILGMLVEDRSLIQRIRENAYNYVRNERMEQDHVMERICFYRELAKVSPTESVPSHLLEPVSSKSEVYHLKVTPSENKMIRGLNFRRRGLLKEARQIWSEAIQEMPEYYLPLLLVAGSLMREDKEKAMENLHLSLTINPQSLRARFFLGQALKDYDSESAREAFEMALQVFPDFAPAWKELALLKEENKDYEEATKLMDKSLKCNPFYVPAASELGRLYLMLGRSDLAVEAFRVAANLMPEKLNYEVDFIKALIADGKPAQAIEECKNYLQQYPQCIKMHQILEKISVFQGKDEAASQNMQAAKVK
jgi:tetratricopeptide (TPR) repeat protein